ncbi:hypothetical protein Bca4012_101304 [Brassica carinata]
MPRATITVTSDILGEAFQFKLVFERFLISMLPVPKICPPSNKSGSFWARCCHSLVTVSPGWLCFGHPRTRVSNNLSYLMMNKPEETEAFDNESGGESCANGRGRRREKAYENPAHERCKILSHPKKKGRDGKLRSSQSSSSEIESEFSHHDPAFARINNGSSGSCPSSVIAAQRDWQLWFLRQPNRFFFDETAS